LEEVLRTSHRIVVLRDHKKAAEYPGDVDDHTIIQTMAGIL
jgi:ABC-type sugar transport system ATPase subunit